MSWQTHHGRRRFSVNYRTGGQTVWSRLGDGPAAELAANQIEARKLGRAIYRRQVKELKAQLADLDGYVRRFDRAANTLLGIVLTAGGYYRHDQGVWRRMHSGRGEPSRHVFAFFRPLRQTVDATGPVDRAWLRAAVLKAAPPQGNYSYPPIGQLEEVRPFIGCRKAEDRVLLEAFLRKAGDIWAAAHSMAGFAIGAMAEKLAIIRGVPIDDILHSFWEIANQKLNREPLSNLEAMLVLRYVACQLWAEHAAAFSDFVAVSFRAGMPAVARRRLAHADRRASAAHNSIALLNELILADSARFAEPDRLGAMS